MKQVIHMQKKKVQIHMQNEKYHKKGITNTIIIGFYCHFILKLKKLKLLGNNTIAYTKPTYIHLSYPTFIQLKDFCFKGKKKILTNLAMKERISIPTEKIPKEKVPAELCGMNGPLSAALWISSSLQQLKQLMIFYL